MLLNFLSLFIQYRIPNNEWVGLPIPINVNIIIRYVYGQYSISYGSLDSVKSTINQNHHIYYLVSTEQFIIQFLFKNCIGPINIYSSIM